MPESTPPLEYEDFTLYRDDDETDYEYTVNPLDKIHYPIRQQADVDEIEGLTRQLDAVRQAYRKLFKKATPQELKFISEFGKALGE